MKNFLCKEEGMVQVEAIIVIIIWMNVIFFLMNIGVVMYQQMNVVVAANEAATNTAETYSMLGTDPFISQVTVEDLKDRDPYRYFSGNTISDNWTEIIADWYACFRVKGNEFGKAENKDFSTITTKVQRKNGMRVLEVTIEREYPIFILNPVEVFGLEPTHTVKAVGSAVCYDVIHDMNMIAWQQEVEDKVNGFTTGGAVFNNFVTFINKIIGFFK